MMMTYFRSTCAGDKASLVLCLILALSGGLAAAPAAASPLIKELGDTEMAAVRGKYAGYGQLLLFGVEMTSQWQTQDGRLYQAGLRLDVDSVTLHPTITLLSSVMPSATPAAATAATGSHVQIDSSGLQNVTGVVQGIQIGGSGNTARNDMAMSIRPDTAAPPPTAGSPAVLPGRYQLDAPGATAAFDIGKSGLTLALTIAGQGQLTQALRSGRGLQQFVQISGDQNQVHNSLRINAAAPVSFSHAAPVPQQLLEMLKGLPTGH